MSGTDRKPATKQTARTSTVQLNWEDAKPSIEPAGKIITTPFSYVATTSAILWEGCEPVFVDIDPRTCCIDPTLIEAAITPDTTAILGTHVYSIPWDVEAIDAIRQVASGKSLLDPMATQRVLERLRNGEKHDTRLDALSDQEKRILELIGEGMTNRQIGGELYHCFTSRWAFWPTWALATVAPAQARRTMPGARLNARSQRTAPCR